MESEEEKNQLTACRRENSIAASYPDDKALKRHHGWSYVLTEDAKHIALATRKNPVVGVSLESGQLVERKTTSESSS